MRITRISKHILKFSNNNKLKLLEQLFYDYEIALDECLNLLLSNKLELKNLLSSKDIPTLGTINHSQWKQIIYKHASEILRSLIKKNNDIRFKRYKKVYSYFKSRNRMLDFTNKRYYDLNLRQKFYIKPEIKNISIMIDERLFDIKEGNYFDEFIKVRLPYFQKNKRRTISINLPIKQHRQSLKFKDWNRNKSIQLNKINNNFYINFSYEKDIQDKENLSYLGIDIGYKKLITTSNGDLVGTDLENICDKISKMKRSSNNYKQELIFRNNYINKCINDLNLNNISTLIVEDLKNVKHESKFSRKFNNKLQYWTYRKVLNKLKLKCEEQGITIVKVSPSYTSQTCSRCKIIDKESRKGERFICKSCGLEIDADYNAAINILNRGVYSPSNTNNLIEKDICP